MNTAQKNSLTFYQKLGYLFYSVAAADKNIAKEEKEMLHKMVMEDWLPISHSSDDYGTDAAYEIEIVFDYIEDQGYTSERAYHVFEKYYKEHAELFTNDVNHRIFHTTDRIASAFNGKNKNELTALTRVHFLLGKEQASV